VLVRRQVEDNINKTEWANHTFQLALPLLLLLSKGCPLLLPLTEELFLLLAELFVSSSEFLSEALLHPRVAISLTGDFFL
jgi:hypothetical protein